MVRISNVEAVVYFRRRIKTSLVKAFGGKCAWCKVQYHQAVYDFHHINPSEKLFQISGGGRTRSKEITANEAEKCVMLCANCHRLIHLSEEPILISEDCKFNRGIFFTEMQTPKRPKKEKFQREKRVLPSREELKDNIRKLPLIRVGLIYGVSDNAIRKWCIKLSLPNSVAQIKEISDEDWTKI